MGGKIKNDTTKELNFTLVTCAPSGTLGDVSSCKKYIEETLASQTEDSQPKTRFNLVITGIEDRASRARIKALLGEPLSYKVYFESGKKASYFNQPEFMKSDAFIFYPSFQITPDVHIRTIKSLKKPVLIVNHYNFEASTDKRYASKKEQWMPSLYTGFGPDSLGVNIKDLGSKPSNAAIPNDDANVFDLVFGTGTETQLTEKAIHTYSARRSLFFGYMNKLGYVESRRNLVNPTEFAKACIEKSKKQHPEKEIDVLVRLNDKVTGSADFNYYDQLVEYFRTHNAGLAVSIYKKDNSGNLVLKNTFGDGTTKVRIIDPFPVTNITMINMMQLSDPLSMMTGSESFIESLSCNKLPLYQIMVWHDRLYNELLKEIASIDGLGSSSFLYQFFAMQDKSKRTTYRQIVNFLCENEPKLLEQLQVFKTHLLENKQLRSRLHNRLIELVSTNDEYIHQCLSVKYIVDLNDEPELTSKIKDLPNSIVQLYEMFPQNRETICQDSAELLSEIVSHHGQDAQKLLDFVNGYKKFKVDTPEYNLFPDILSRISSQKVKDLIVGAELEVFSSKLERVDKVLKDKYPKDSTQYLEAIKQLDLIKEAKKVFILDLLVAKSKNERTKAISVFQSSVEAPALFLDTMLDKHILVKAFEYLLKAVCAVLGFPIIAVIATSERGRENINKFFSSQTESQRELKKVLEHSDKEEENTPNPVNSTRS